MTTMFFYGTDSPLEIGQSNIRWGSQWTTRSGEMHKDCFQDGCGVTLGPVERRAKLISKLHELRGRHHEKEEASKLILTTKTILSSNSLSPMYFFFTTQNAL
jgi:hypothetical protein